MRNNSEYAYAAFLVSLLALICFGVVCLCLAIALVCLVRKRGWRSPWFSRVTAVLLMLSCTSVVLGLSTLSGFDYVHPALILVVCCALWLLTCFFTTLILHTQWGLSDDSATALKRRGGGLTDTVRRLLQCAMKEVKFFNMFCIVGYLACYVVVFSVFGICVCSNPQQVTTWTSRRNQAHYCFEDQFCHQYVLLGYNASSVRLVGHVVSQSGANSTVAEVCLADASTYCVGPTWNVEGRIAFDIDSTDEDSRYVSWIFLTGLAPNSVYRATVTIFLKNGVKVASTVAFRTVPGPGSHEPVTFISGGDIMSSNAGQLMVFYGLLDASQPSFILFGGDLGYWNNMRTCYLRVDFFLSLIASLRTREGLRLPIVVVPGNHDSGGYLPESDWSKYFFYPTFFPQYDNQSMWSQQLTYHTHHVGPLSLIVLDSGLFRPFDEQVPYLEQELQRSTDYGNLLVTAYHNPMFPSVRSYDNDNSVATRNAFLPMLEKWNVTLSLEFHDHSYKRTKVRHNGSFYFSKDLNRSGLVFVGDGGLGVDRDASAAGTHDYLEEFASETNVQTFRVNAMGSHIHLRSFSGTKQLLDEIVLPRNKG